MTLVAFLAATVPAGLQATIKSTFSCTNFASSNRELIQAALLALSRATRRVAGLP